MQRDFGHVKDANFIIYKRGMPNETDAYGAMYNNDCYGNGEW